MKTENLNHPGKLFLFKIRLIDIYCKISAKIWVKKDNLLTAIWFLKRAVQALIGKEGVIDGREVYSKGGYKYYQIEISKFPFNANSDYTKLK